MHISWKVISSPSYVIRLELENRVIVPLFEFDHHTIVNGSPEYSELMKIDLEFGVGFDPSCVRRVGPTTCYNCHGLTFASRRGWLNDVELVIKSERYRQLVPSDYIYSGDIIEYVKNQRTIHTGIVLHVTPHDLTCESISNGTVKVLSKWGQQGEFIHDFDKSPYGVEVRILRYIRTNY